MSENDPQPSGGNKYRTLAKNTALLSVGTFSSKLLMFLMVRFYTGYLTPSEYGTTDLIAQTANLLIPILSLDMVDGVFRFCADRADDRKGAFSVGAKTVAVGSTVLLLAVLALRFVPAVHDFGLQLAAFAIASMLHSLCAHFVRACGNTALFAFQGIVNTVVFIALNVLFLAVLGWGVNGYVLATVAADVTVTLLLIFRARLWRFIELAPDVKLKKRMLRYCVPLIPTAIFWWIMGVSDRYMVKLFLGSEANGIYAVAYKIPTVLTILVTLFIEAWQFSAITEQGDRQAHLRFYGRIWDAFASTVFLGAGVIIALSPILIRVLADEPYFSAWRYIPVLTASVAAASFSNFIGSIYVVTKRSTDSFMTSLAGAATNIMLNPVLIPALGIQGAAVATLVSCAVVFLIRLVGTRRLMPFPFSAGKTVGCVALTAIQTVAVLRRPPMWAAIEAVSVALLALAAAKPLLSAVRIIFCRKREKL